MRFSYLKRQNLPGQEQSRTSHQAAAQQGSHMQCREGIAGVKPHPYSMPTGFLSPWDSSRRGSMRTGLKLNTSSPAFQILKRSQSIGGLKSNLYPKTSVCSGCGRTANTRPHLSFCIWLMREQTQQSNYSSNIYGWIMFQLPHLLLKARKSQSTWTRQSTNAGEFPLGTKCCFFHSALQWVCLQMQHGFRDYSFRKGVFGFFPPPSLFLLTCQGGAGVNRWGLDRSSRSEFSLERAKPEPHADSGAAPCEGGP